MKRIFHAIYVLMFHTVAAMTVCLPAAMTTALPATAQSDHNFETAKQLDIFNALYRTLDLYYVDTLDAGHLVETAIGAMLDEIDPYTEYYRESDTGDLRTLATGKYAGIGSPIIWRKAEDRCVFHNPYRGMPADKAGVKSGDIIYKIDGEDLGPCGSRERSEYTSMVSGKLRGEPGTKLTLTVKRPGTAGLLTLHLVRENIKRPSVTYAALLDTALTGTTRIGYIILDSFTEDTAADFQQAFRILKADGAERLIVDLRGNGGGLISQAVEVVSTFVPRGSSVVETRGRETMECQTYKTKTEPLDTEIPLAILVDYGTASASEITSGAIQDYDRGVVIGLRTYGKGLVQSPRQLPYNTMMKFTTAKYYIPSGRCVQARDFKHRDSDGQPAHLPDSLCHTFYTAAGRPVRDGGGITPDITTRTDSLPTMLTYLEFSDALFDYCVNYQNTHPSIAPAAEFHLTAEEFEDFKAFMAASDFTYDNRARSALKTVRRLAEMEGYSESARAELDALEAALTRNLADDLQHWEQPVRKLVEAVIVGYYYYDEGNVEYNLPDDPDVKAAVEILNDTNRYHQILNK